MKELYRQKAENGRKEHMLRYPNYKYVPAKKRKDQNAISNPLKKRGTLVDEGETPEEYIALAYWNMESPPLENYANVKLRPTYGPNVISQIPPKEGFQDQINYHFNQGNIGYAGGIGPHGSLTQYAPSDLFTYTSSARYPAPHQGGGGFDLNFASTPYTDSAASALGVSNLCSVQSLIPPRSDSIQNEDHYAFLPFLYQNPLFPQES